MYIVPHDINPELQLVKSFSMKDLIFAITWVVCQLPFILLIHRSYRWGFIGFHILLALFLITKVSEIPNRKYWQGFYFWMIADRKKYGRIVPQKMIPSTNQKGGDEDVIKV